MTGTPKQNTLRTLPSSIFKSVLLLENEPDRGGMCHSELKTPF